MRASILETDAAEWREFLLHAAHDFYHLPGYVRLAAAEEGGVPVALFVEDGPRQLLLPLIIRPIPASAHTDATSPYGYPGPLVITSEDPGFEAEAWRAGLAALREAGVVSLFVRLHPLLNGPPPAGIGEVVLHGETVSIALDAPAPALWEQLRQNHRRGIRRAIQRGLTAREDPTFERFPEFRDVYRATMERRSASPYYFFSDAYFAGLRQALGDALHLIVVELGDQVAAAGLFVETGGLVQYHLGGTHEAFARDEPSKLLFHFASAWASQRGDRHLHLGGGVGGADDSLFLFKAGFSDLRHPYRTLRVVLDAEEYGRLAAARTGASQPEDLSGYFPTYRGD